MSRCAFIRITPIGRAQLYVPGSGDEEPVWIEDATEASAVIRRHLQEATLIALVPSQDCLIKRLRLPVRSHKQLEAALPFAIEEDLVEDLEEVHIAFNRRSDGDVDAVVVSHDKMALWQQTLAEAGFIADMMIPEVLALPESDNVWHVMLDGDIATVRCGKTGGFAVEYANLPVYLDLQQLGEVGSERPSLQLHGPEDEASGRLMHTLSEQDWQLAPLDAVPFPLLSIEPKTPDFDLLQGRYQVDHGSSNSLRAWAVGLACAFLLGATEIGYLAWDNQRLAAQSEELDARIVEIYRLANPDATRVVNAKAQMRQLLNSQTNAGGKDFLGLMREVSEAFADVAEGEVSRLSFNQGKLDMDVTVSAVNTVEILKNKLADRNTSLTVLSLDSGDHGIAAHLRAEALAR